MLCGLHGLFKVVMCAKGDDTTAHVQKRWLKRLPNPALHLSQGPTTVGKKREASRAVQPAVHRCLAGLMMGACLAGQMPAGQTAMEYAAQHTDYMTLQVDS
jgi:hypothetical protein